MRLFPKLGISKIDLCLMFILYLLNSFLQLFNLRYVAAPYTDEGIYLYSAKLITQGYLPYRDFILTHPPLAIFLIALFFKFWDERLFLLRIFYALFIQTAIFPLFILVKKNTKSIWAALTAVALFSTFVEFMHHDARFFALRQCEAVIFIYALFIFFLFESNFSQFFAGFLLGTGISLTFAHILIVIPFFIGMFLWQKKNRENFFIYRHFLYGFSLSLLFLILVFIIPRAWDCLIKFQLSRPRLNLYGRVYFLKSAILNDPFIFLTGIIGSFCLVNKLNVIVGITNLLTLFFITFLPNSLFPHYYTVLGPTLALAGGNLFKYINKNTIFKFIYFLIIIFIFRLQFIQKLKYELLIRRSPEYYEIIEVIKLHSGKLFTIEPIYALDAGKDIPYYYFVADNRVLRNEGKNISYAEYKRLIDNSSLVLIDRGYAEWFFPLEVKEYIKKYFRLLYMNDWGEVYIRK